MYTEASKKATVKYMKKLKRIPVDVQMEQYNAIKKYANEKGKPVNTVLKEIIFEKVGINHLNSQPKHTKEAERNRPT